MAADDNKHFRLFNATRFLPRGAEYYSFPARYNSDEYPRMFAQASMVCSNIRRQRTDFVESLVVWCECVE